MPRRVYEEVRCLVEHLGGSMTYEREGYRHGAWVIRIGEKSLTVEATGYQSFPELDALYVPKVASPTSWEDYSNQLVPDAEAKLLAMLDRTRDCQPSLTEPEADELARIIERTQWKFAWTYARTYPHEYTTKEKCAPEDHSRLIEAIERYGRVEPFGKYSHKYLYFQERRYWHMGDPYSENPEDWPNVINRQWLDVRRHAANVQHVWTEEEVQLQVRLWEIQIEKATAKAKR